MAILFDRDYGYLNVDIAKFQPWLAGTHFVSNGDLILVFCRLLVWVL